MHDGRIHVVGWMTENVQPGDTLESLAERAAVQFGRDKTPERYYEYARLVIPGDKPIRVWFVHQFDTWLRG